MNPIKKQARTKYAFPAQMSEVAVMLWLVIMGTRVASTPVPSEVMS
jgi:hypothetical protein